MKNDYSEKISNVINEFFNRRDDYFCVPHHAQATELDNIIDGVQILDRDGKPIDSESDSDRVVDSQEDIVVVYNWSIKDNQPVHAGDTVHIQIPKEFKIYTTVQGELVISDGGGFLRRIRNYNRWDDDDYLQ